MIEEISFAEVSNNQQNLWALRDKVNEIVRFINDNTEWETDPVLRDGVTVTKNGRYMLGGKFISKEEAYAQT